LEMQAVKNVRCSERSVVRMEAACNSMTAKR
jgi:hypothetical protein